MDDLLSGGCEASFESGDRRRGDVYLANNRIEIQQVGHLGARAVACGSSGEAYCVSLDFAALDDHELGVYCDCLRFTEGYNCKHLWAFLRRLEAEHGLHVDRQSDLYLFEGDREPEIGRPFRLLGKQANTLQAAESRKSALPEWRLALNRASRWSNNASSVSAGGESLALVPTRYTLVIRLADLAEDMQFQLHVYQSKSGKNGWSKPRRGAISRGDLELVQDPSLRRAFSLLNWSNEDAYASFGYRQESQSKFTLEAAILNDTLVALCDSGQFVFALDSGVVLEETRPIQYGGATPWQFLLVVGQAESKENVLVQPTLHRTTPDGVRQTAQIDTVVGICESGAVLFEDQVAQVRQSDVGWVRGWQRTGSLQLPKSQLGEMLDALHSEFYPPELELDVDLGVQQSQGTPIGKLKLTSPVNGDLRSMVAEVFFKYDGVELPAADPRPALWAGESNSIVARDWKTEGELHEQLQQFNFYEQLYSYSERELRIHRRWFSDIVRQLSELGWEVVADGKTHRGAGRIDIQVTSGEDWFDLSGAIDFQGISADLPALLQAVKRGDQTVILDDGTYGILPEEWLSRVASLAGSGAIQDDSIRFQRSQALLLDMMLAEQDSVNADRKFINVCNRLRKFSGVKPGKEPRGFQGQLREYQRDGLGWFRFLKEFGFGGCLADDMGLGKTVQVLALLQSRRVRRLKEGDTRLPSIVVVPKSLVFNWIDEARRFSPGLRVVDYTGTQRSERFEEITDCDLVVTTFATCRLDIERLSQLQFDYAILDEAQAIKNPNSQVSKAVRLLVSRFRLAMTGTPIENHLGDLWSLFDFLNPGMLGNARSMNLTFAENEDSLQVLRNALKPFILRRTKSQVLTELPEKTEQTLYCDLSAKQKKLYNELRDHYRANLKSKVSKLGLKRSKIHVLEALLRLRQAACDPRLIDAKQKVHGAKIDLLMEQLRDVIAKGHKALVFSQFTSLLALVKRELDREKWTFESLDGKTRDRQSRVRRFQEDPNCQIFLISLKAGGHGLNLTAADYVFILDPWWNPAIEAQAIDRAHRMGQTKPVVAYRLIARETVEDKIVKLQQSKRQLADAIISADQSLLRQLSVEDLQILFD